MEAEEETNYLIKRKHSYIFTVHLLSLMLDFLCDVSIHHHIHEGISYYNIKDT